MTRRPYLSLDLCIAVIESPIKVEIQGDGRVRYWGHTPALGGRILRVVTLSDRTTIHNAFIDRGFRVES